MNRKLKLLMFAIVWGLALLVALAIHFLGGVDLWLAIVITAIAWIANGLIAELEDRRPGGFLNPKKKRD